LVVRWLGRILRPLLGVINVLALVGSMLLVGLVIRDLGTSVDMDTLPPLVTLLGVLLLVFLGTVIIFAVAPPARRAGERAELVAVDRVLKQLMQEVRVGFAGIPGVAPTEVTVDLAISRGGASGSFGVPFARTTLSNERCPKRQRVVVRVDLTSATGGVVSKTEPVALAGDIRTLLLSVMTGVGSPVGATMPDMRIEMVFGVSFRRPDGVVRLFAVTRGAAYDRATTHDLTISFRGRSRGRTGQTA
jgi:hypothetical protein